MITTPIAAFLISRINPVALGGLVGSLIVILNFPNLLPLVGLGDIAKTPTQWVLQAVVFAVGAGFTLLGVHRARAAAKEQEQVVTSRSVDFEESPAITTVA